MAADGFVRGSRWPLDAVPYSDYFADLIVLESAMVSDGPSCEPAAVATGMQTTFVVAAILIAVALVIGVGGRALARRLSLR